MNSVVPNFNQYVVLNDSSNSSALAEIRKNETGTIASTPRYWHLKLRKVYAVSPKIPVVAPTSIEMHVTFRISPLNLVRIDSVSNKRSCLAHIIQ